MRLLLQSDYGVDIVPLSGLKPPVEALCDSPGIHRWEDVRFAVVDGSDGPVAIVPREGECLLRDDCSPVRRIEWDGILMGITIMDGEDGPRMTLSTAVKIRCRITIICIDFRLYIL